jgi:ribosomal protein S14
MTQRQIRHAHGEVPACTRCSTPDRTVHARHIMDLRAPRAGGGHFLECSVCGHRTARHRDFWLARAQWVLSPERIEPIPLLAGGELLPSNVRGIRSRDRR